MVADIAKMPHLLIAGATGSGKSVCINTLIMSHFLQSTAGRCQADHDRSKGRGAECLQWHPASVYPGCHRSEKGGRCSELGSSGDDRTVTNSLPNYGVRDLKGYNQKIESIPENSDDQKKLKKMPQIVIIVDELADLMMVAPGEVEDASLPSGTACKSSRHPSDHCNTAAFRQCYHRSDQGKYAVKDCIHRLLPVWIPGRFWI